jgi:hypothetical protein
MLIITAHKNRPSENFRKNLGDFPKDFSLPSGIYFVHSPERLLPPIFEFICFLQNNYSPKSAVFTKKD